MSKSHRDITRSSSAHLTQLRVNQPELMKGFTASIRNHLQLGKDDSSEPFPKSRG